MKRVFIFLLILSIHNVYADPINQNVTEGCDDTVLNTFNNVANLIPAFSPTVYNCSSGQFLPADTTECKSCPSGYTCAGGNMTFNENNLSGINDAPILRSTQYTCSENFLHANNNVANLIPVFEISIYDCNPGYYVPADTEGCTKCPNNHYCPGGTYTFNETTPQGIIECPENHPFAPAGMWQQSQCGRKLHIGDDVLYMHQSPAHPTTHRLFIGNTNGIYSANTIQRDMNSNTFPKMSAGAQKGLHVMIGNVEYLVCDDSVPECVGE